jgi:hypothetical protein
MHYLITHKDTGIQISFIFKAFLMNNGTHINVNEKNKEAVLDWFCEYAYFAIDKYGLYNFRISSLKFNHEKFNVNFEIKDSLEKNSLSLFNINEIIKLILKPDPKKEFPLVLEGNLYYPIGYVPEY